MQRIDVAVQVTDQHLADLIKATLNLIERGSGGRVKLTCGDLIKNTDILVSNNPDHLKTLLFPAKKLSGVLINTDRVPPSDIAPERLTYLNVNPTSDAIRFGQQLATAMGLAQNDTSLADPVICLGASTGGIDALICVLQHLRTLSCPILIVQHTGPEHLENLCRVLAEQTGLNILPGTEAELQDSSIYLATDANAHMVIANGPARRIHRDTNLRGSWHTPSIDALFRSASRLGRGAIGVLLTGMGRDGAAGLRDMHLAGALTVVQDAETSVVYGMPKVAFEIGAASKRLPLDEIGPQIIAYIKQTQSNLAGGKICKQR